MEHFFVPFDAVECIGHGSVLVLAPHPDDEVFGCGGAIMRHIAADDPVHVIILTGGGCQHRTGCAKDEARSYEQIRMEETIRAASILGYGSPVFWDLPDRGLFCDEGLVQKIVSATDEHDAALVYAPSVFEIHPDHRVAGLAAAEAVRRRGKGVELAMYEVGMPIRPNRLLDISDLSKRKQAAMECFSSQLGVQRYDAHISALNRYRAYTLPKEVMAAEAYLLLEAHEISRDPLDIYESENRLQKKITRELISYLKR